MGRGSGELDSRLDRWRRELATRLRRSGRVFLLTLSVACAVEILVDAHVTLNHVNVVRHSLKQKGRDYVSILRRASRRPMEEVDKDELSALVDPFFGDPEVFHIRFRDPKGNIVYERTCEIFGAWFEQRRKKPFAEIFKKQLERDAKEILKDPTGLIARYHASRHRDVFQRLTAVEKQVFETVVPPEAAREIREPLAVLYQDRLKNEHDLPERDVTWAVGAILGPEDEKIGSVLIAFDTRKQQAQVREKLVQGLGVVVFFVGIIVVQSVMSRRSRLRLLELEAAEDAARRAVRAEIPPELPQPEGLGLALDLLEGRRLGGATYTVSRIGCAVELLLVLPERGGVEGAVASVALVELYREAVKGEALVARFEQLAREYVAHALARRTGVLLLRVEGRRIEGVSAGLRAPAIVDASGVEVPPRVGVPLSLPAAHVASFTQPPRLVEGEVPRGGAALLVADCTPARKGRVTHEELLGILRAAERPFHAERLADRVAHKALPSRVRAGARRGDDAVIGALVDAGGLADAQGVSA